MSKEVSIGGGIGSTIFLLAAFVWLLNDVIKVDFIPDWLYISSKWYVIVCCVIAVIAIVIVLVYFLILYLKNRW